MLDPVVNLTCTQIRVQSPEKPLNTVNCFADFWRGRVSSKYIRVPNKFLKIGTTKQPICSCTCM